MAKTYNGPFSDVATGDVYTAAAHNLILENVDNYRVPPMVEVRRTTTQSTTNVTWAYTSYDASAAIFDTDSMWDSGNPTYITIKTAGVYLFSAQTCFANNGTGARLVTINKNSATPGDATYFSYSNLLPQTVSDQTLSVSSVHSCAVNDKISVAVYQSSGGSLNLSLNPYQALRAVWLGQVS